MAGGMGVNAHHVPVAPHPAGANRVARRSKGFTPQQPGAIFDQSQPGG